MPTEAELQVRKLERFAQRNPPHIYGEVEWARADSLHLAPVRQAIEGLPVDTHILEIGPGGGRWTRDLLARRPSRLTLVDGTLATEQAIRNKIDLTGTDVRFYASPTGTLPFLADASVDALFTFDVFVHFHRTLFEAYLAELRRVLKPGGHFVFHYAKLYIPENKANFFEYVSDDQTKQYLQALNWAVESETDFQMGAGSKMIVGRVG